MGRVGRKERAMGRGHFYTFGGGVIGEAGRVDRKEGAMGRGDFTDGMPGWSYFSRATLGHPASMFYFGY